MMSTQANTGMTTSLDHCLLKSSTREATLLKRRVSFCPCRRLAPRSSLELNLGRLASAELAAALRLRVEFCAKQESERT